MAAPTVNATDITVIDSADSTTNWSQTGQMGPVLDNDIFLQGSGAVGVEFKSVAQSTLMFDRGSGSTIVGKHIRIWIWAATATAFNTKANHGLTIRVIDDGGTNFGEWDIAGSDFGDWLGDGWKLVTVDCDRPFDRTSASAPTLTLIQEIGIGFDVLATLGKSNGLVVDQLMISTTADTSDTTGGILELTGGTTADPITLQEIITKDEITDDTWYGLFHRDKNGNIELNGRVVIGDVSGSGNTVFVDTNERVLAGDNPVSLDHIGITILHDSGTTEFTLGQKIGSGSSSVGANGVNIFNRIDLFIKNVFLKVRGTGINNFLLYGCVFTNIKNIEFGADATPVGSTGDNFELVDNTFSASAKILKNIGAANILLVNNRIAFSTHYRASIDIDEATALDILQSEFALIQASGLIESQANTAKTFRAIDFNFNQALVPYVNLTDADEIWDIINPDWTIETGTQKQLDFADVPTITDNGEITTDVMDFASGTARNCVRASDGTLYVIYLNNATEDIEIRSSSDDGGTWSAILDDANSPIGSTGSTNPACAIDSNDVIQFIWYDGTGTDLIVHSTFDTTVDQYNTGSAAVETTVRSGVTTSSPRYAIAIDSNDDAQVAYIDQTINDVFYNNGIDFSTNEVTVQALSVSGLFVDIVLKNDIPIVISAEDGTPDFINVDEGNARDATSFTNHLPPIESLVGGHVFVVTQSGLTACITDDDNIIIGYTVGGTGIHGIFALRHDGGSDLSVGWTTVRLIGDGTAVIIGLRNISVCAVLNKVYLVAENLSSEIIFFESKTTGIGWTETPTAVTVATTSDTPILRATHGLNEGEIFRIDIIYRDGTDNPQHAELENVGLAGDINEKFEVVLQAKEPDGTLINNAREKLVEANPTPALANEDSTGAAGQSVTIEFLRRLFEPNLTTGGLTVADHNPTIVKSYKYIKLPFVTNLGTILAKQILDAIHLIDTFNVETTPATAITLGDTTFDVQVELQSNSATLFKFTGGSGVDPSVGDTIGNDSNSAEGVFVELMEGDFVAGTMLLDTRDATAWPTGAHTLDDAASGGNWTATFTSASIRNFKWLVDAATLTPQQLYDYFNAKFNEATLDTASDKIMDQVAIWGRAEHGLPIQGAVIGSPNKFQTVRNVAITEGWAVYNIGGVGLSGFTQFVDDAGTVFTPAATVTITITVLEAEDFVTPIVGARVGIHRQSDNSEIVNDITNGSGVVSASFTYTVDVDVFIKVRQETEDYPKIPATITSTGLTQTIAVADDDIYTPT